MEHREYFSSRTGAIKQDFGLPFLRRAFLLCYAKFERLGYFQEYLGYYCVDAHEVLGLVGMPVAYYLESVIYKSNLWPIEPNVNDYSEDDAMDMIEFLFDHVSQGIEGTMHSYNDCGMHYSTFDRETGQAEFRAAANQFLAKYSTGFELSEDGRVLQLLDSGLQELVDDKADVFESGNLSSTVEAAKSKFRRFNASIDDKRDAVRDLAGVLEYQRKVIVTVVLKKDEDDLFNLANNFGIRHHNDKQKTGYDQEVWLDWMFFYYLATIQATSRLLLKQTSA